MKCPKCHFDNPEDTYFCGKCAAPLRPSEEIPPSKTKTLQTPVKELTRGSTFAKRYEVIEELGKGGMGRVYRVEDKKLKEEVALKLLKPEIAAEEQTIERFSNELKFARKVVHKNVCRMYDLSEEEGTHYITMEYVPGEDLKSTIRRVGQLSVGKAISIAKQVCQGLAEAHRLGVVHRDLKPQNIMIDREGNARIMDFGIARSLEAKGITDAGMIIGTPEYMSPEQVEGKEADGRSDIYSLGIILYEMLTGRVPFSGDTPLSIAVKHKTEAPPNPREINAQIPEDLSRVILRCMEKDKGKRYQKAEELLSELSNIEKGIPTTERILPEIKPETEKIGKTKITKYLLYGGAAILLILLIVGGIYLLTERREAIDSIAVLPFAYTGDDPNMEYLSDGMTESIINSLSQLPSLNKVIARSSVFRYKGQEIDPQVVGQELGVDAVLISRMSQRGDDLSLSVELVNTTDNSRIWGNQYKRKISDIFDVQEEISNAITNNLRLRLTGEERKRLTKHYTEVTEAYQLYFKGRFFWNRRTEEDLRKAISYFELSIEKDPSYALAYVGMADSYNLFGRYCYLSPKEAFPRAKVAVEKALNIDDMIAEAHTSLAYIKYRFDWDWYVAEREFQRAIELNPSYATAHHWYSVFLRDIGRLDEALVEINRAHELDPLSLIISEDVGQHFYFARQYDQAIEQYLKTIEMDPNFIPVLLSLGDAYEQKSMFNEAIAVFQKAITLSRGSTEAVAALGHTYAVSANRNKALKVLDDLNDLSKRRYVSSFDIAIIYAGLSEKDQAFQRLEKAYEERDGSLIVLKVEPKLDSLRLDPRYIALLKKMGLQK